MCCDGESGEQGVLCLELKHQDKADSCLLKHRLPGYEGAASWHLGTPKYTSTAFYLDILLRQDADLSYPSRL